MSAKISKKIILKSIIRRIVSVLPPEEIILFGSYVKGKLKSESDIDIAVIYNNPHSKRQIAMDIYMALAGLGVPIDIIILATQEVKKYENAKETIIHEIIKNGRTIFKSH